MKGGKDPRNTNVIYGVYGVYCIWGWLWRGAYFKKGPPFSLWNVFGFFSSFLSWLDSSHVLQRNFATCSCRCRMVPYFHIFHRPFIFWVTSSHSPKNRSFVWSENEISDSKLFAHLVLFSQVKKLKPPCYQFARNWFRTLMITATTLTWPPWNWNFTRRRQGTTSCRSHGISFHPCGVLVLVDLELNWVMMFGSQKE